MALSIPAPNSYMLSGKHEEARMVIRQQLKLQLAEALSAVEACLQAADAMHAEFNDRYPKLNDAGSRTDHAYLSCCVDLTNACKLLRSAASVL